MQITLLQFINISIGVIIVLFFLYATGTSVIEKEKKAAFRFFLTSIISGVIFFAFALNPLPNSIDILLVFDGLLLLVLTILFFPYPGKSINQNDIPVRQYDERQTMFSRKDLAPGSTLFTEYYKNNPSHKEPDDAFRKKPGLLSHDASKYEPLTFAAAEANFSTVAFLKKGIDGPLNETKTSVSSDKIVSFIRSWAKILGAHSIGFTMLKDYHLYHTKGRGERYNQKVQNHHKYAIAITVEMDKEMMDAAPNGPTVMESAQQYLRSGIIAIQIGHFIRSLGYEAKSHIDGNYDLVCPLVARDAGLGEMGRMGLLMVPKLGPRVRIAVVTTNLPLKTKPPKRTYSTLHFCEMCKKCADNCPSEAIPFDQRKETENGLRWQISSEKCYTYWCIVGTDCGKCVAVCPYSHPDSILHNFIRWGIRNNLVFRKIALPLDDFYYGRKPNKGKFPDWMSNQAK